MKKMFTFSTYFFFLLLVGTQIKAQTVYRSLGSGAWATFGTWERSTDNGVTFAPAISGQLPTSNNSVIIASGHTVTIEATKSCLNLTIQSGGRLSTGGGTNAFSIRPGTSSSGTSGTIATVQNDGILGGTGELMVLELPATAAQVTVQGTGTYEIGRIRAITTNTNYPTSATTGHANNAKLIIDRDMKLNGLNNYAFSEPNSAVAATDVFIYTINAGKTVTVADPGSRWENTIMATDGVTAGGSYTYNINGTLDLSATTATSSFIPYANASSSITVNVNGTVKLGAVFKADTVNTSLGAIALNINNGALVDATATTTLTVGKTGTASGNIFFVTNGTGALRRAVGATDVTFPVGAVISSYSPVVMSNAGTLDNFTVNVSNTITNAAPVPTKVVNKQWTINEAVAGGTVGTIRLSWTTASQAASFNPAGVVVIASWNGTRYIGLPAVVTGTGTAADPYIATATGFTDFNRAFIVANLDALPLSLAAVKAYQSGTGIKLDWATSTEINTDKFIVEKSADGTSFTTLGTVTAKGNSITLSNYSLFDAAPVTGNNYYRLKMIDKDGSYTYSVILKVAIGKVKTEVVIAPNPVKGNQLNVQLNSFEKGTYNVNVYNNVGQLMLNKVINHEGGSAAQVLNLPAQIKTGTYQVVITGTDVKVAKTIIVE